MTAQLVDTTGTPYEAGRMGTLVALCEDEIMRFSSHNHRKYPVRGTLWERVAERTCVECGTISPDVWIELCPSCRERIADGCDTFPTAATQAPACAPLFGSCSEDRIELYSGDLEQVTLCGRHAATIDATDYATMREAGTY